MLSDSLPLCSTNISITILVVADIAAIIIDTWH
jgi:hypothetical protein